MIVILKKSGQTMYQKLQCKTYSIAILQGSTDIKGVRIGVTNMARQPIIALNLTTVVHDHNYLGP